MIGTWDTASIFGQVANLRTTCSLSGPGSNARLITLRKMPSQPHSHSGIMVRDAPDAAELCVSLGHHVPSGIEFEASTSQGTTPLAALPAATGSISQPAEPRSPATPPPIETPGSRSGRSHSAIARKRKASLKRVERRTRREREAMSYTAHPARDVCMQPAATLMRL
jgi:hypothetical protein